MFWLVVVCDVESELLLLLVLDWVEGTVWLGGTGGAGFCGTGCFAGNLTLLCCLWGVGGVGF